MRAPPHSDDDALCFYASWPLLGGVHWMVTVFSESDHCAAGYVRAPGEKIRLTRENEDRRYCHEAGIRYVGLGFEDRPELVESDPETYSILKADVEHRLIDLLRNHRCRFLVAHWPWGDRQHVHHRLVWEVAAGAIAHLPGCTLIGVDDIPYSRRPVSEPFRHDGVRFVPYVVPLDPSQLQRKLSALRRIYRSQMRPDYLRAVARAAPGDDGPSETLWMAEDVRLSALEPYARSGSFEIARCPRSSPPGLLVERRV